MFSPSLYIVCHNYLDLDFSLCGSLLFVGEMASDSDLDKPLVLILFAMDFKPELEPLQDIATVKIRTDFTNSSQLSDEECSNAVGFMLGSLGEVDSSLLDRCKKLRVIARLGIGVDKIDLDYAAKVGVHVCNVPDYGIEEVADTAFSHILSLFRQTTHLYETLRTGSYTINQDQAMSDAKAARRIRGKTLGLIGVGNTGVAVTERAKAFGFKVIFYDPFVSTGLNKALGVERLQSVEELVKRSDCVSLHCTLTPQTKHIVNESVLRLFKKEAFLVNVARGALVDEGALAKALKEGWIAGAALDVFEKEPFAFKGSVFEDVPNLICTPHCAWYSLESMHDLITGGVKCIQYALTSSDPSGLPNCLNRKQLNVEASKTRWNS